MAVKKLSELTVAELKHELKKRKLDYTGDRSILIVRLRKSLVDENKAKLMHKANEVEGGKKPAEETQVDRKESENVAGPASVSEESVKASQLNADSTLPSKNSEADVSAISNSEDITASVSISDSTLEQSAVEGVGDNSSDMLGTQSVTIKEDIKTPNNIVEAPLPQDNVPDFPSDSKIESDELKEEKMESEDTLKEVTSEKEVVPEKMDDDDDVSDSKSEGTPTAVPDVCSQIQKEQNLEACKKKEPESLSDSKVESVFNASEDLAKYQQPLVDDAKKEETVKTPQSEPSIKTETENPEVLGNVMATAAPKINEVSEIEPTKPDVSTVNSLWVSGLVGMVKATDLKQAFNQCGRVASAKIVTSAKCPGSRCFGLVTMHSHEDALKCINAFNGKTVLGSLVAVELDMKHRITRPQTQATSTQINSKTATQAGPSVEKPVEVLTQNPPIAKSPQKQVPQQVAKPVKPEPVKVEVSTPEQTPIVVKPETQPPVVVAPKLVNPQQQLAATNEKQEVSTSVWLSGFPDTIKAAELKAFCLSAGKVNAAKVVANAKLKTYYGLVTMATLEDAQMCLKKLHNSMYNKTFKITCEMSPSNTVTTELLKHFSKSRVEQSAQQQPSLSSLATKPTSTTQPTSAPKPAASARLATSTNNNNSKASSPRRPDPKNITASKRGRKRAPLMKTPVSNRNFRRPSPKAREDIGSRYGMPTGRTNISGILDGGLMGRSTFGTNSRSIMDDRRSLMFLEEERRLTQDLVAINAQKEKLQLEALRLEREREKMETLRQSHISMPRRDEWKPLLPSKRPHEDEVCWRPPPHSSAKRFGTNSEYDSLIQMNRRPPLLDERDVRYGNRNAGGSSLLGPRDSFPPNRHQDHY